MHDRMVITIANVHRHFSEKRGFGSVLDSILGSFWELLEVILGTGGDLGGHWVDFGRSFFIFVFKFFCKFVIVENIQKPIQNHDFYKKNWFVDPSPGSLFD